MVRLEIPEGPTLAGSYLLSGVAHPSRTNAPHRHRPSPCPKALSTSYEASSRQRSDSHDPVRGGRGQQVVINRSIADLGAGIVVVLRVDISASAELPGLQLRLHQLGRLVTG